LTDPYVQYGSIADWACDGPYPVYDDPMGPQCQALRGKIPTCQRLINSCYKFNSKFTCVPAVLYCNSQIFAPLMRKLATSASRNDDAHRLQRPEGIPMMSA
jgi:cathepsin A (carboxypeptidase C)